MKYQRLRRLLCDYPLYAKVALLVSFWSALVPIYVIVALWGLEVFKAPARVQWELWFGDFAGLWTLPITSYVLSKIWKEKP